MNWLPLLAIAGTGLLLAQEKRPSAHVFNPSTLVSAQFTPDGKLVAAKDDTGAIHILDEATGHAIRTIPAATGAIAFQPFTISPDGRLLATAAVDAIRVFTIADGTLVQTLSTKGGGATALAFTLSGDELRVVAGDIASGKLLAWSTSDWRQVRNLALSVNEDRSFSCTFVAGGDRLAIHAPFLEIRDAASGKKIRSWDAPGVSSPDGALAALAIGEGSSGRMRIVEVSSGRELKTLPLTFALGFTRDSKGIVMSKMTTDQLSAALSNSAPIPWFVHELSTGQETPIGEFPIPLYAMTSFHPNGKALAYPTAKTITVVSLTGGPPRRLGSPASSVSALTTPFNSPTIGQYNKWPGLAFSPDGRWLANRSADGPVEFFDLATGARSLLRADVSLGSGPVKFTANGRHLAFIDEEGARLYEIATGKLTRPVPVISSPLMASPSIENIHLAGLNKEMAIGIWNIETGQGTTITNWSAEALSNLSPQELVTVANYSIRPPIAASPDGKRFAGMQVAAPPAPKKQGRFSVRRLAEVAPGHVGDVVRAINEHGNDPSGPKLELGIYDMESKQRLLTLESHQYSSEGDFSRQGSIIFSPDGRYVAAGTVFANVKEQVTTNSFLGPKTRTLAPPEPVRIWNATTGQAMPPLQGVVAGLNVLAFSNDGRLLAATDSPNNMLAAQSDAVSLWDVASGRLIHRLTGVDARVDSLAFSRDSQVLAASAADGLTRFWNVGSGQLTGTLISLQGGDWLALATDGQFDGSPGAWSRIQWRSGGTTGDVGPVELYFNEFYRPGLLAGMVAGDAIPSARPFGTIDRRQPVLNLSYQAQADPRKVRVRISVKDGGAGVHDVRLFRGGVLVKAWRGEQKAGPDGSTELETEIQITAGDNRLVAYCFNAHNVKSADAAVSVVGAETLKRKGNAWVLAIGVDEYENSEFNLKYATADAKLFAGRIQAEQSQLGTFENVEVVEVHNREATRANILSALQRLSGLSAEPQNGSAWQKLRKVQPEDSVFLYFAGHGFARGDRFYLVPHDLGYKGPRSGLAGAIGDVAARAISDLDLERLLETVDARHIMLVIDSCQSGQALESEDSRRGPMNSRGLAQLAYEKGIYILTAAQSYQAALETSRLGHGLLTYALIQDGLNGGEADVRPRDGRILAPEWIEYAAARVPQLQSEAIDAAASGGRVLTFEPQPQPEQKSRLQVPRAFSRPELARDAMVIGLRKQ